MRSYLQRYSDESEAITESNGIYGEFAATFELVDGEVDIDTVDIEGTWTYIVTGDEPNLMVLKFTNSETGDRMKLKCWMTSEGDLTSTLVNL